MNDKQQRANDDLKKLFGDTKILRQAAPTPIVVGGDDLIKDYKKAGGQKRGD